MGGTMRLGLPGPAGEGSVVAATYGDHEGRRAPPAPLRGQQRLPRAARGGGAGFSGTSPDGRLVEFVELPADVHPYYVGHPGPPGVPLAADRATPGLIGAALRRQQEGRLVEVPLRDDAAVPPRADEPTAPREERGRPRRSRRGRSARRDPTVTLSAPVVGPEGLGDDYTSKQVLSAETVYRGMVWDLRKDRVDLGAAGQVSREYIEHPGAVSVVALRRHEGRDELVLIKQYRASGPGHRMGAARGAARRPWRAAARRGRPGGWRRRPT
jgi:hypothetical protein